MSQTNRNGVSSFLYMGGTTTLSEQCSRTRAFASVPSQHSPGEAKVNPPKPFPAEVECACLYRTDPKPLIVTNGPWGLGCACL